MATPNELVEGLYLAIRALEVNNGGLRIVNMHLISSGSAPVFTGLDYNNSIIVELNKLIQSYEASNVPEI